MKRTSQNKERGRMLEAGRAYAINQAKRVAVRTRDTAENLMDDGQITPDEYAADQLHYEVWNVVDSAAGVNEHRAGAAKRNGRYSQTHRKTRKNGRRGNSSASTAFHTDKKIRNNAEMQKNRDDGPASQKRKSSTSKKYSSRRRSNERSRIENRKRTETVKNRFNVRAESSQKNPMSKALRTTRARQFAVKSAQESKKTEFVVRRQAERTARTAKELAQAARRGARAAFEAAKTAMTAVTAGGSAAMFFLVMILLIALLAGSVFAIFLPSDDSDDGMNMRTAIHSIEEEYSDRIEEIKADYTYDEVEISGSRAPWRDILAVYAVKVSTDPENPQEVVTMDLSHLMILREVFWDMNEISEYTESVTETEYVESEDEEGNPVTETIETEWTILHITVTHWSAAEQAQRYSFSEDRLAQLEELLSPQYASLWNDVLYGTHSGNSDLVAVALSQIGNTGETYWTYMGYTDRVEWCACFVSWCANECGYIENGTLPKTGSCSTGVAWFQTHSRWQGRTYINEQGETVPYIPDPGDIIYFDWDRSSEGQNGSPDHVGIVEKVENGYIFTIEGNSGDLVSSNTWAIGYYEVFGYGVIEN